MRLDIYREFLLKINRDLNIDSEYTLSRDELRERCRIGSLEELKKACSQLYPRNKFYYFEEEATLEEPFTMKVDLRTASLLFSLNPVWKRKLFFKGRSVSESLMDIWKMVNEETDSYDSLFPTEDDPLSDFRRELKRRASLKGGHNQMVIIGLIERAGDIIALKELAGRYDLLERKQEETSAEDDWGGLTLEDYKSRLRERVAACPSYKRMSLLGYISRAGSIEELKRVFSGDTIDEEVIRRIGESFTEERRESGRADRAASDEKNQVLEVYKSEIRQRVMKMSTFNKMTILGFIGKAVSREEIDEIVKKYGIK